jgi:hypothetical protein
MVRFAAPLLSHGFWGLPAFLVIELARFFLTTNEHQFTRMTGNAYSRFHLFFPREARPFVLIRVHWWSEKNTPLKRDHRRLAGLSDNFVSVALGNHT